MSIETQQALQDCYMKCVEVEDNWMRHWDASFKRNSVLTSYEITQAMADLGVMRHKLVAALLKLSLC